MKTKQLWGGLTMEESRMPADMTSWTSKKRTSSEGEWMDRKCRGGTPKMPGWRQGSGGDSAPLVTKAALRVSNLQGWCGHISFTEAFYQTSTSFIPLLENEAGQRRPTERLRTGGGIEQSILLYLGIERFF